MNEWMTRQISPCLLYGHSSGGATNHSRLFWPSNLHFGSVWVWSKIWRHHPRPIADLLSESFVLPFSIILLINEHEDSSKINAAPTLWGGGGNHIWMQEHSESANSAKALHCRPLVSEHISYKMPYLLICCSVDPWWVTIYRKKC